MRLRIGLGQAAALLVTGSLAGCLGMQREMQVEKAIALTPAHFKETATVQDDSLDTVATISTRDGFQEHRGLLGVVWDDNYLRAFIDKKTGATTFQVYQIIYYQGSGWNFYKIVNYETPDGPQTAQLTLLGQDVDCTGSRYTGCTYEEVVAFDASESLLRELAARYSPGQRQGWRFKYTAQSGQQWQDGMLPAEIQGCLDKVDEYRNLHGLPAAQPVTTTDQQAARPSPETAPVQPAPASRSGKATAMAPDVQPPRPAQPPASPRGEGAPAESDDEYNRRVWQNQTQ